MHEHPSSEPLPPESVETFLAHIRAALKTAVAMKLCILHADGSNEVHRLNLRPEARPRERHARPPVVVAQAVALPLTGAPLSACAEQILQLFRELGHRMTAKEIAAELRRRGHRYRLKAVQNVLNYLSNTSPPIVTNRHDVRPRGYGLAEWP